MSNSVELASEIAKLQKIHISLAMLSDRTDDARKMELVHLRRELATQIGTISNVAEKGFLIGADAEVTHEFRAALSAMRRAVALHQANFPAVDLDNRNAEYQVSVREVRESNVRFMAWASAHVMRRA